MSRNAPDISVMMPVYNAAPYLDEAIEGIRDQTWRNWELIVLNDGSTDESLDIAMRYAACDNRIRVISRANKGLVATRNELLNAASAPLVAVNDADDISVPNRLELQVQYLRDHPQCVALGSRATLFISASLVVGEEFELQTHEEIDRANLEGRGSAIAHSASMYRTDAARQVGGYHDEYPPSEDLDLWLRLAEIGRLANLPQTLVRYRLREGSMSHRRRYTTMVGAWRAMRDAHARRGLPFSVPEPQFANAEPALRIWARSALSKGRFSAARRISFAAVRRHPFEWPGWRLFLGTLAGPGAGRVVRVRDVIRRALRAEGRDGR